MKYYIIAGEASGDLHGSNLLRELKGVDPEAVFRCWGGERMQAQGGYLVKHYKDLAFMGFLEVLLNLGTIAGNLSLAKKDILAFNPDVVILIDYPGFNLRMAKFLKKTGIRVFYYISPQLWAWKASRVRIIKRCVERMFVILPFEKDFYASYNYRVDFIGHPLLDVINDKLQFADREIFLKKNNLPDKPIIALLPGSRKQEIRKMLNIMEQVIPFFADFQFLIAGAPSIDRSFYADCSSDHPFPVIKDQTYNLIHHADAALVTSGTATLETALIGTPEIVCYKGNLFSYLIARQIVHVKFISLVNLIMDKSTVKELIQDDLNKKNLEAALKQILTDQSSREQIKTDYRILQEKLGGEGASKRAAELMVQYLTKK